ITKFEDYSNGTIPFMYHCHLLSHEDEGMMGQYTVTDITAIDDRNSSTDGFSLDQNYPNPFNPNTSIMYTIPEKSKIQFSLYNIQGELVREIFVGENEPGYYKMSLAMSEYTSGVYFIRFMASNDKSQFSKVLKIVLIK
ncbi:MAG: T9SS type A sorting domain-containing protein, partial [Ignavibacteriales bacterium]|nr:T9SS type A sorting domain-containing protein [Ignavibacteriales bacterium]